MVFRLFRSRRDVRRGAANPAADQAWNKPPNPGGGYDASDGGSNGTGYDGYFIDDNTFGTNDAAFDTNVWDSTTDSNVTRNVVTTTATTKADDFAGLCARCHADSATQTSATLQSRLNTEWSGHGAVAGFATTAGRANNDILLDNQARHMHANEGLWVY